MPKKYEPIDKQMATPQILIKTIYSLLEPLPPYDYSYKSNNLPVNGIYFFYEDGEQCKINGNVMGRIVRVGTHQSDNRFRDRIRNHYIGNKNSSVFRKHVGSAIINKNRLNIDINEWMKSMTPTNNGVERSINEVFKKRFRFRCVPVQSKNNRLCLEEKLIATLSRYNFTPSDHWLGHWAKGEEIRGSGLWNVQHTNSQNIMSKEDLINLKKSIASIQPPQFSSVAKTYKERDTKQNKVICFIPCCKRKSPSGNIIEPKHVLSPQDLPNTWKNLVEGRKKMQNCVNKQSRKTSAINLYSGHLYSPLSSSKEKIIKLIRSQPLRLIIISAGYGIIDALEPIHNYDARMSGRVATDWRNMNLTGMIADPLLVEKPKRVYGFFTGETCWSTASKYRYFFTKGVKTALEKGLDRELNGCFYGSGMPALGALGRTFIELLERDFNDSYVKDIYKNGRQDGNVKIMFDKIPR